LHCQFALRNSVFIIKLFNIISVNDNRQRGEKIKTPVISRGFWYRKKTVGQINDNRQRGEKIKTPVISRGFWYRKKTVRAG